MSIIDGKQGRNKNQTLALALALTLPLAPTTKIRLLGCHRYRRPEDSNIKIVELCAIPCKHDRIGWDT